MIQMVEQPNAAVLCQVKEYLFNAQAHWGASPEHDPRWLNVLRDGLGHRTFMLIARANDQDAAVGPSTPTAMRSTHPKGHVCGYLPLALVGSPLFGRFLVSLPYLNRAGVVTDDGQIASKLVDRAVELAQEQDVQYLELRDHGPVGRWLDRHPRLGASKTDKMRMVMCLPDSQQSLWQGIGPKVRNQVRKGDKHELKIRWGGVELLDQFYKVFAVNMRDLGTPVYPKKLFLSILEQFSEEAEFAVVDYQSQVVAAALLVHDHGSTQVPSASSLRRYSQTNANMWMYHQLLLRTIERGGGEFDFGRSSEDSGTYRFKKQWGATPCPTGWHYHVRRGDIGRMRPDNPRNRWRVAAWKKLPVWITRRLGPAIVRGIP